MALQFFVAAKDTKVRLRSSRWISRRTGGDGACCDDGQAVAVIEDDPGLVESPRLELILSRTIPRGSALFSLAFWTGDACIHLQQIIGVAPLFRSRD